MIDDSDKAYKESRKRLKYRFENSAILKKLPGWFKTKWSTKVRKLQQTGGHSAFPSFSEFVEEVNFHAE
ncbi:unnamed protein product [Porites evermanni]|uniref:Uncharacterized protein n=1 Tax=Porites evermanni TaxID=104178 RepID=A0ABN8MXU3_9CNID|nr:unnamed protein product [Porites evermanni]